VLLEPTRVRSWTLQARDAASTNLPRSVVFTVTSGGSAFDEWTSDATGISTTIYAPDATTYLVDTTWGTHTVDSAESITLSANTASTIDTKIQRLTSGTNYALMSLDNTDLPTPALEGEANILLHNTVATGSLEFKCDHLNWKSTTEPTGFEAGARQYSVGDEAWTWASSIFSLEDTYSATQDLMLYFTYTPPSSGNGGSYTPPPEEEPETPPEEEPTEPEPTVPEPPQFTLPQFEPPELTPTLAVMGVAGMVVGVALLAERKKKRKRPKTKQRKYGKNRTKAGDGF